MGVHRSGAEHTKVMSGLHANGFTLREVSLLRRALAALILAPLLVGCGGDVAPTVTPVVDTVTPVPTGYYDWQMTATANPRPTWTWIPTATSPPATATRAPLPPTAPPPPTATPVPGIGGTITTGGWLISLAKMESYVADTGGYELVLWVDARNQQPKAGKLSEQVQWKLQQQDGVLIERDHEQGWNLARFGRDSLGLAVKPQAVAHTLVLFPTNMYSPPRALQLQIGKEQVQFDLRAWPTPTPMPHTDTPEPATATPLPDTTDNSSYSSDSSDSADSSGGSDDGTYLLPQGGEKTFEIAHVREQGVDLIIIPVSSDYGDWSDSDQQDGWQGLQLCASAAGLRGTVVPVWKSASGRMWFLAPHNWHPFFKSLTWRDVLSNINKELTCRW